MAQHRPSWRRPGGPLTTVVVALAGTALLAGCGAGGTGAGASSSSDDHVSSSGSALSRARLYGSLQELTADSPVIVAGTAGAQEVVADITPGLDFTLTSFEVGASVRPAGDPVEGQDIVVRQVGSADQGLHEPLLVEGQVYLLFLTPSGLDGDLASHYYPVGVTAGLYALRDAASRPQDREAWRSVVFEELAPAPGDVLPDTVTETDVTG